MQSPRDRMSTEKKLCIKTQHGGIPVLAIKEARENGKGIWDVNTSNVEEKLEKYGFPGSQAKKVFWEEKVKYCKCLKNIQILQSKSR